MEYIEFNEEKFYVHNSALDLVNLGIEDITQIKGLGDLNKLKELNLTSNRITNIQGLENLLDLEELYLDNNAIEVITGLNNLKKLKTLDLRENKIQRIENLEELHNLEILDLSLNPISELSGLEHLKNLRTLIFFKNLIREIKFINELDKLEELRIENNSITEIKGLENLYNLKRLYLSGNKIKEIKGLDKLTNLRDLSLSNNKIHEIKNLDKNINLEFLSLEVNKIKEIRGFGTLANLKELYLDSNQIHKISNLGGLRNLRSLLLRGNKIAKIEGLDSLINLESLLLDHNQISEINGLDKNVNIIGLYLENNMIYEIKNLDHLENLRYIDLANNKITELKNLENLKSLEDIELGGNDFKGFDEYIIKSGTNIDEIKEYCRQKIDRELPRYDFYNKYLTFDQNILEIKNRLNEFDDSEFIKLGTFEEDEKIRDMQNFYFLSLNPKIIILSKSQPNLENIRTNLIQLHSLKGIIFPREDKIKFFISFLKHFWNNEEVNSNSVLIYRELEIRVSEKIKELLDLSVNRSSAIPNIIIFPECSLPYYLLPYLIEFSKINKLMIIGGLEHQKLDDRENYLNQAIIIDKGNYGFQIKQTPVQIKSSTLDNPLREKIDCVKIPRIRIFATSLGKIAIFICRDFLRLHEKIPKWVKKNEVDYIIIPSLTSKVLPFHSKLLNIFNQSIYNKIKIIFINVGEYGGSEVFSINHVKRIEESFRVNARDNVGEIIVTRKIGEAPKKDFLSLMGKFMFNWAKLENLIRRIIQKYDLYIGPRHISFLRQLDILFKEEFIPIKYRKEIDQIRYYRNSIVHGIIVPTLADLSKNNRFLEELLKSIPENISVKFG